MDEIKAHLAEDLTLKKIIDTIEFPSYHEPKEIYLSLISSIVSQQLSTKAADTIHNRFLNLFENKYPYPEDLIKLDVEMLQSVGLSRQKASYILNVANFELEKGMKREQLNEMSDTEVISYLTQIKGVGKWTVEMLLMFNLNRPDVFPVDDLGIQKAIINLYGLEETGKLLKNKMESIAEIWKPYRTTACKYLWRWKDIL